MRRIATLSLGLLVLVGCGGSAKHGVVSGTITYNNAPVNNATLYFYPSGSKGSDAIPVPVGQDGAFRAADVPVGDYKIAVQGAAGAEPPPSIKNMPPDKQGEARAKWEAAQGGQKATIAFPAKYKELASTTLTCTVTKGETKLDLKLTD